MPENSDRESWTDLLAGPTRQEPAKIAPPDEDLDFVRHDRSGRVHVIEWEPEDAPMSPAGVRVWEHLIPIRTTLCGAAVFLADGGPSERWHRVGTFDDDRLCRRCHSSLGDQAWRAFEHPQACAPEAAS